MCHLCGGLPGMGRRHYIRVSRNFELKDVSLRVTDHTWYPTNILI